MTFYSLIGIPTPNNLRGERSKGKGDPNTSPESLSVRFGTARVLVISIPSS